jgi:hypothetical protein
MRRSSCPAALLLAALSTGSLHAMDYFISPAGNDAWSGRLAAPAGGDGPWRTLAKAAEVAGPGDVVALRAGLWRETLRPARSGSAGAPLVFRAYAGEQPVLTGADAVEGWRRESGGLWSAPLDWDLDDRNQVFAGETALPEARWPNAGPDPFHPNWATVAAGTATTITDPQLTGEADSWNGALLWIASGAEWIVQSVTVTAFDPATQTLTFTPALTGGFYQPRKGNRYVLIGARAALDAPGEWWFDRAARRLWLRPLSDGEPRGIEAKRRPAAIDLRERSWVQVVGLGFRAAGLATDGKSEDLLLDGLRGEWVGHSYRKDVGAEGCVAIRGARHTVRNCRFAYGSSSVLRVDGRDHRVFNCQVQGGNYGAKWSGTVALAGRRIVFAWNTVRDAGRDLLSIHGLTESRILHNDLGHCGWLTCDLGLTYGHNTDFGGTEIAYNLVHDNHAHSTTMGIYFDHLSHNCVVHHNAIWNIGGDPVRVNNPSYYMLVYHNSAWRTGQTVTFDHTRRNDLFGCRFVNNLVNAPYRLPAHVVLDGNQQQAEPGYVDPARGLFALKPDSPVRGKGVRLPGMSDGDAPDPGAFAGGREPWRAGCDLARPLQPEPTWQPLDVPWLNALANACFELGTLEGWTKVGAGEARLTPGNGWGNTISGKGNEATGTSRFELCLTGRATVEQTVERLRPNTAYTLAGWLRASAGEQVALGLRGPDGQEQTASSGEPGWVRRAVAFTTGAQETSVTVFVRKTSDGPGQVWADNLGLPRVP